MSDLTAIVKEMYAAFGRGDVEAILAHCDPDVSWEFEAPAEISFAGIRRGREGARGFFEGIAAEHAEPMMEMTEWVSSGDAVAVFGRYQCTLRATGQRVSTPVGHYFEFRDGKVVRYINMLNTAAFVSARAVSA